MARDYERQAAAEDAVHQLWLDWLRQRVENIHAQVTAHAVLTRYGVNLVASEDDEEQFACPFHGLDKKPSARVYPASPSGPTHAWCFVCQERWDSIALWKKFNDPNAKFSQTLREIEEAFGLQRPPPPDGSALPEAPDPGVEAAKAALAEFKRLLGVVDRRLRSTRGAFRQLDDLHGFLVLGQVADKLASQVERGKADPADASSTMHRLLDKIAEKVRQAPEG